MSAPTQYYLTFKANCCEEYDVYQSHRGDGKGALWTSDEFITTCLPGKVDEFVEEYNKELLEGEVCGYEVEEYIKEAN